METKWTPDTCSMKYQDTGFNTIEAIHFSSGLFPVCKPFVSLLYTYTCNYRKPIKGICEAQGATAEEVFGCLNCENVNKETLKTLPDLDPQNKFVAKGRLKRTATGGAVVGSVFAIGIIAGLGFLAFKKVSMSGWGSGPNHFLETERNFRVMVSCFLMRCSHLTN